MIKRRGARSVALVGAAAVSRWFTSLATSGWMAFAIPSSVGVALLWATRSRAGSPAGAVATVAATALVLAAALHLALDLTWLSVADPMP